MRWALLAAVSWLLLASPAGAQPIDLSQGGPIEITARDGIEWRQQERQVIARGDARAVRQGVTVTADRLTAFYRPKAGGAAAPKAPAKPGEDPAGQGSSEIYRVQAEGNVHITTQTDQAQGDKAVYDIDQAVMVMTGRNLRLTTPENVLTARDTLEYWSQKHMAVARGDAVVVTKDARRLAADTLVAYTVEDKGPKPAAAKPADTKAGADAPPGAGKLERVEAFGHVSIRTPTDTVTGDRAVYVPDTGMARLAGAVRITRGQNQLNGGEADVNMKTGIAKLISAPGTGRVAGLVLPNDETNKQMDPGLAGAQPPKAGPKP